ncbi:MAG: DNA-directed RNA polymerase [Nanoarchaeota archaeon]|nr:DNA-directed RNA polymerase [Nanoarchaeota archaeon]
MYELVTLRDKIRVEPQNISKDKKNAIKQQIKQEYIGKIIDNRMLIVGFIDIIKINEGIIIPNDPAVFYDTIFNVLAYLPMLHETVRGQVTEISEIGAMVNIGPIDGLVHISQVMDDFVDFSKNALVGRKSKTSVKVGDTVIANISVISTKGMMKIGLTMRSPGLGKLGKKKEKSKA